MVSSKKTAFLDRDGVINYDYGHVFRVSDFHLVDGVIRALKVLQDLSFQIIIVTNQAGIAKGMYTEHDLHHLNSHISRLFAQHGIRMPPVYYCPHHPHGSVARYTHNCKCRKPQSGMITNAISDFHVDIESSLLFGDKLSDIEAAQTAGIPTRVLIAPDQALTSQSPQSYTHVYPSLNDAVDALFD